MKTIEADLDGSGIRVAVIAGRFNHLITHRLLEGCLARLDDLGCDQIDVLWVPGAFEIPLAASRLAASGRYDALIALGAVIRGGTAHFDFVCRAVTDGLVRASLDSGIPAAFGVLTTDTVEQALERSVAPAKSGSNKGTEAAQVAIEMASLLSVLEKGA